jgi:CHAD domain-containing protein
VAEAVREVETKFDIAPDFTVPDLSGFGDLETDVVDIASSYWDTDCHDLLRFGLTLRRRTGGADTGWQLKIPGDGFRTELHWPDDENPSVIPAGLLALIAPFTRGRALSPAVRLDTTRTRYRLTAEGTLLAEVARDAVRAVGLAAEVRSPRWHEAEVELGPAGDAEVLAAIGKTLRKAGAITSTSRSKVGRALLGIGNEGIGTPRASAGAVLTTYLGEQTDALVAGYFAIIDEEADPAAAMDAIHKTRVACRRSRSTLKTFIDWFDEAQAEEFEGELKWYAELLGEVRDREVLRSRIANAIRQLPPDLVVGRVAEDIDARLAGEQAARRVEVLEAMKGQRYAELLGASVRWRDDPPFTAAAGRPARTLREGVERAERKLGKRLTSAVEPHGTDEQLHGARKAGKRARYAVEATEGELSKAVRRAKELQDLLGEFHDGVVAAAILRRLAADAWARGENGFTYGVLLAEERSRADAARGEVAGDAGKRFRAKA